MTGMPLETILIIIAIVVALVVIGVILLIRSAKRLRRMNSDLDKDWLEIELLMKRRNDELPRLIQTCRSYMPADKEAFKLVSEARSSYQKAASMPAKAQADALMTQALRKLSSEAERFPELKSNHTFRQVREQLLEIEERIVERGELFNQDIKHFNTRLEGVPGKWVRGLAKARPRPVFEITDSSRPSSHP